MSTRGELLSACVACLAFIVGSGARDASASQHEAEKLSPPAPASWENFGHGLAVDGDWMIVGAPGRNGTGAALVYQRSATTGSWSLFQELAPSAPTSEFGNSVAIFGRLALVGAPIWAGAKGAGLPSAYVYKFTGTSWVEMQRLTASNGAVGDYFGDAVAIYGPELAIGAPQRVTTYGSVYRFEWDGSSFVEKQELTPFGGFSYEHFGYALAIREDVLVVGAPRWGTGHAYAFVRDRATGNYLPAQVLKASDPLGNAQFGNSVTLNDEFICVGAHWDWRVHTGDGAVYSFHRETPTTWKQTQKLRSVETSGWFGNTVRCDGDRLLVGSPYDADGANADAGRAYLFQLDGREWRERRIFSASDSADGDYLGGVVALSGSTVMVAAEYGNAGASGSGAVYRFDADAFALSATPDVVKARQTLTFDTVGGQPGGPAYLALVAVSGYPTFWIIASGTFAPGIGEPFDDPTAGGEWELSFKVPRGLAGTDLTLQTFGITESGEFAGTNPATVTFQ